MKRKAIGCAKERGAIVRDRCALLRSAHPNVVIKQFMVEIMHRFPLCRAKHWRFYREQPEGGRQGCRTLLEGQESLPATPDKIARAQEASGIRGSFLLDTFLWTSKEKYLAHRCENRH